MLLNRRIRICANLQKLCDTPKLHTSKEFKDLVLSVKPVWPSLSFDLKAKITFSCNHVQLELVYQAETIDEVEKRA